MTTAAPEAAEAFRSRFEFKPPRLRRISHWDKQMLEVLEGHR